MIDEITLKSWACALGFAELALCGLEDYTQERRRTLSQQPLSERRHLRFYPREDYPQGKSLAVMLWPYVPRDSFGEDDLFIDSYYAASNAAYHAARKLEARLLESGQFAKANVSYPAKAAAVRAGLGFTGKNDLLYTTRFGTRVVIMLMITDIPAGSKQRQPLNSAGCLACGLCAKACPSGALDEYGMSHPERCMRNFMMEGVVVPQHLRKRMGMRLIGCDICQRVCPMQPAVKKEEGRQHYSLDQFVTEDSQVFSQSVSSLANEIGRNAARPQRVRAQAALLAGNSARAAYMPVLKSWADSEFDAVREHALWAIRQIELTGSV